MIRMKAVGGLFIKFIVGWFAIGQERFERGKKITVYFPGQSKGCSATVVSLPCHLDGDTVRVKLSVVPKFDLGQIPGVVHINEKVFITIPKEWCRRFRL